MRFDDRGDLIHIGYSELGHVGSQNKYSHEVIKMGSLIPIVCVCGERKRDRGKQTDGGGVHGLRLKRSHIVVV